MKSSLRSVDVLNVCELLLPIWSAYSYQKIRLSCACCTYLGNTNSFLLTKKKNDATTKSTGSSAGYFECFVSKQEMIHVAD